jgi:hypothetical protein
MMRRGGRIAGVPTRADWAIDAGQAQAMRFFGCSCRDIHCARDAVSGGAGVALPFGRGPAGLAYGIDYVVRSGGTALDAALLGAAPSRRRRCWGSGGASTTPARR